jgi:predicted regulator of Ras-like GTPase activity (Roadblock/LC7/MglB family)
VTSNGLPQVLHFMSEMSNSSGLQAFMVREQDSLQLVGNIRFAVTAEQVRMVAVVSGCGVQFH